MAEDTTVQQEGEAPVEGAEGADAPKKKFGLKKILIIALPIVVLAAGGAGAYFMGFIGGHDKPLDCASIKEDDADYAACAEQMAAAARGDAPGVFIDIPNMTVNLSSASRQPRFLNISLKVELEKAEQQASFEAVMPRVIDQFQAYLRELRVEDLRGSSGMYRMKIELLSRVRAAAPEANVKDVLFQEILIQ